jgi:hypothetical protein
LRIIGDLAAKVAGVLGVLGAASIALAVKAGKVAMEFDNLARSFAAFLGSEAAGRQAARFVEFFGLTSPFEQRALQEAARYLLAVGLDLKTFLPIAQNIALMRGAESQNIIEVAELMQRAVTGATGFAFGPRGLRRFGLTPEDLAAAGATFRQTATGVIFQGGAEAALKVIEAIGRLPKIAALGPAFEMSPMVVFSNAMDALNKVLREVGDVILSYVVPVVLELTTLLQRISVSGVFAQAVSKLFEKIAKAAGDVTKTLPSLIEKGAAMIAAIIANLPELWRALIEGVKAFVNVWLIFFKLVLLAVAPFIEVTALLMAVTNPALAISTVLAIIEAKKQLDGVGDKMREVGQVVSADYERFLKAIKTAKPTAAEAPEIPESLRTATKATGAAAAGAIATSEALKPVAADFRRFALGGGDVGRLGLTPVEMARIGAFGGEPRVRVRVRVEGADALNSAIEELIRNVLEQYEEQRPKIMRGARL